MTDTQSAKERGLSFVSEEAAKKLEEDEAARIKIAAQLSLKLATILEMPEGTSLSWNLVPLFSDGLSTWSDFRKKNNFRPAAVAEVDGVAVVARYRRSLFRPYSFHVAPPDFKAGAYDRLFDQSTGPKDLAIGWSGRGPIPQYWEPNLGPKFTDARSYGRAIDQAPSTNMDVYF